MSQKTKLPNYPKTTPKLPNAMDAERYRRYLGGIPDRKLEYQKVTIIDCTTLK